MGVVTICPCRHLHVVKVCIKFYKLRCLDFSVAGSDVLDVCELQKSTIAINGRIHGAATDRPTGQKQIISHSFFFWVGCEVNIVCLGFVTSVIFYDFATLGQWQFNV